VTGLVTDVCPGEILWSGECEGGCSHLLLSLLRLQFVAYWSGVIMIREIASDLTAAAVSGADFIPDHKLYVIPCGTAGEAARLATVLNSDVVRGLVRAFSVSTSLTGSFLRYVGVRDLADYPDGDGTDGWLAGTLGVGVEQLATLRRALSSSPI
jgi:hypothetical protein